jgi:hypothetical protein
MTDDRSAPVDPRDDREIWDLVAALPVPAAAEDFMPRLRDRIAEEPGPAVHPGARARARGSSPRRLFFGIAAAAVAALICALVVLPALRGTPTATAGDMLASMNAVAGSVHVVRLTITEARAQREASASPSAAAGEGSAAAPQVTTEQLTLSTSGDVRYTSVRPHVDGLGTAVTTHLLETYDSQRHEMMRQGTTAPNDSAGVPTPSPYGGGGTDRLIEERPSWGTSVFSTFLYADFQALSNSLRARLAEGDPNAPVTETTYLGRPAWHADLTERMPSSAGSSPGGHLVKWSVTVDKATGLLVASDFDPGSDPNELKGLPRSFRVTRLEVDPRLPSGWQRIPLPKQGDIAIFDPGTRFGTPETVALRSWPTLVLIPQEVPAGYRLTDVATRDYEGMRRSPQDQSRLIYLSRHDPRKYLWKRISVDASVQRVMVRYRRGFSTFVVAITPVLNGGGSIGGSKAGRPRAEDVTLTSGYLKGAQARIWISPYFGGPTLSTHSDRSRITISGDLTRQELIDVANSFRAYGDVGKPLPAGYGH